MTFEVHTNALMIACTSIARLMLIVSKTACPNFLLQLKLQQPCSASSNKKNLTPFSEANKYGSMQNIACVFMKEKAAFLLHKTVSHEISAEATLR